VGENARHSAITGMEPKSCTPMGGIRPPSSDCRYLPEAPKTAVITAHAASASPAMMATTAPRWEVRSRHIIQKNATTTAAVGTTTRAVSSPVDIFHSLAITLRDDRPGKANPS